MKVVRNKDGSKDYHFDLEDFYQNYVVGCLMKLDDKKAVVRVYGVAPDLKHIVLRKSKKEKNKCQK